MRVSNFREPTAISSSAEIGVTVGDVLMKLDKMFDELAEASGNQDPGVRRFHIELSMQEEE
jgi:hypothetical protein